MKSVFTSVTIKIVVIIYSGRVRGDNQTLRSLTFQRLLVPGRLRLRLLPPPLPGCRDTELGPAREPAAVEHLRPREPEGAHHGHAAVPHGPAQAPAGADRPAELRQAHRSEQRAQELLGVPVAQLGDEGQPGRRLLLGLPQRVVAQQVGDPHVPVADPVAQGQGARDGLAHRADRGGEAERRRRRRRAGAGPGRGRGRGRAVRGAGEPEQQDEAERGSEHRWFELYTTLPHFCLDLTGAQL